MFLVVTSVAPRVIHFVASEVQRSLYRLVPNPPIADVEIIVIAASLEKDPQRHWLYFPNQACQLLATTHSDVGTDSGEYSRVPFRMQKRCGKGGNASTTISGDHAIRGSLGYSNITSIARF